MKQYCLRSHKSIEFSNSLRNRKYVRYRKEIAISEFALSRVLYVYLLIVLFFIPKGKGDMTTYWVKGHDPDFIEDDNKNLSAASFKIPTPRNLSKATTPNGSMVMANNIKNLYKDSSLSNGTPQIIQSASATVKKDLVTDTPNSITSLSDSAKEPNVDNETRKPVNGSADTKVAKKEHTGSDLIQFDGTAPDNDCLFTPVELSVAGDTPIDDIVDEILSASRTSLKSKLVCS